MPQLILLPEKRPRLAATAFATISNQEKDRTGFLSFLSVPGYTQLLVTYYLAIKIGHNVIRQGRVEVQHSMQLQINQRLFSFADTYDITDNTNNQIYQVKGQPFAIGKRLELMDAAGTVVATIQQRVISLVEEYDILQGDQIQAVVKKNGFNLLHPHYSVNGSAGVYDMEGDWAGSRYTIRSNGQTVAQIVPELSLAGKYGIEIAEGADVPLLLCLAIVIDEITH